MAPTLPSPKIAPTGTPVAVERAALRSWDNEGGAPSGGPNSKRPGDEKFKKSGPPPSTGEEPLTTIRPSVALLAAIDRWAKQQADRPARAEAICRLLESALAGSSVGPRSRRSRRKATDMAGQEIDRIGDPSATPDERETRKQRLLKGPKEFRAARARQRGD
jgi:hypothetical protein